MDLLYEAAQNCYQAYFFDNSVEGEEEYGNEDEVDNEYPEDYENEEDGEFMPDYNAVNHGSSLLAEEEGSLEADYDAYLDGEGDTADENENGDAEREEEEEGSDEDEYEEDEQYGEEDDEVNYDNGDDVEYGDAPGGFDIDNEHFEKVVLSPRDMELIATSGPSGEVNDLVDIMNEYNELVNYLASPRGNPKKAAPPGAKAATKVPAPPKQPKVAPLPVKRRILPGSDSEQDSGEDDSDKHSASSQALLARDKLSILTGMVGGAAGGSKPSGQSQKQSAPAKKAASRKKAANEVKKKPKKKLFGQALEDHKALAIQLKLVGRSEVDDKHKVSVRGHCQYRPKNVVFFMCALLIALFVRWCCVQAMLANMVEARRRDEEEAQREAERLIAKRKKFKEVWLVFISTAALAYCHL